MRIDLQTHSVLGSADSVIEPDQLVAQAKACGLDAVCLTEHGNTQPAGVVDLGRRHDFLVIPGIEAGTDLGDILIFGVPWFPRELTRAAELIAYVHDRGGVAIAAHPFRYHLSQKPWLRRPKPISLDQAAERKIFRLVDAFEAVNGFATAADVEFCQELARLTGFRATGGSDAHAVQEVGLCATLFERPIRSEADLIAEIRAGRFRPEDRREPDQMGPVHLFTRRVEGWGADPLGLGRRLGGSAS